MIIRGKSDNFLRVADRCRVFHSQFFYRGHTLNSVGVFVKPVTESLGFTRAAFMLYCSISMLSLIVTVPIPGKLLERYNIRLIMTIE